MTTRDSWMTDMQANYQTNKQTTRARQRPISPVPVQRWGPGGTGPQIVSRPSKFNRALDTLWSVDFQKNQYIWCHQMSDFKAKMYT